MLTVNPASPLAQESLPFVLNMFRAQLIKPLDENHVIFSLDAPTSRLVITAREISTNGELGKYFGEYRQPYIKADLARVLPHPVLYNKPYPATYRILRRGLEEQYGIVLEQGEFALSSAPTHPLVDDDELSLAPNVNHGEIWLSALPSSGRWQTDSMIKLIVVPPNGPNRLNAIVATDRAGSLDTLTYAGSPQDYP